MNMQDKDIDELFRSKLNDLEVKPSDRVWKGIVIELDGVKSKRTLVPIIRIAAGITVFIAAGLFFLLKKNLKNDDIKTITRTKSQVIKSQRSDDSPDMRMDGLTKRGNQEQQITATTVKQTPVKPTINVANPKLTIGSTLASVVNKHKKTTRTNLPAERVFGKDEQQALTAEQQTFAAITTKDVKVSQPVVPDEPLMAIKPALAADEFKTIDKVLPAQVAQVKPVKVKKRGIRSFGDLLNVVIAKVDKREDKIIEFSNTDDDEATITGINLGIVKVKKDK